MPSKTANVNKVQDNSTQIHFQFIMIVSTLQCTNLDGLLYSEDHVTCHMDQVKLRIDLCR